MKYTPENRAQWRDWLAKNHARATEVWLIFLKKTTGRPNLSYDDAVEEALCFGWIDGVRRSVDEDRYMQRFTPRKTNSNWSGLNKERARRMRAAGYMTPAGQKAIEIAKRNGHWDRPTAARAIYAMPPELRERLKRNKKAASFFESLAPSYQRQYVAWIATAKRPETRKRRLDEAIRLLSNGQKLGMK